MKLGVLFSGGKDSVYAAYLAKKAGHNLSCLITLISKNKESYMFHTPSIEKTKAQAKVMKIPLIEQKTKGEKEKELKDLEKAIKTAIEKYKIEGVVTGAIESVYQASRVQEICNKLNIECFNPLWQKDGEEYLEELLKNKFKIMIVGVFAEPLNENWLGRAIDEKFIKEIKELHKKYKIHIAGEGGEFESFVLNCPLFEKELEVKKFVDSGKGNSWRKEVEVR
ncbi:Diphthamide synthase [uncultured archaeon]|nr:Diphthamide synthase [uncultured archaeon]